MHRAAKVVVGLVLLSYTGCARDPQSASSTTRESTEGETVERVEPLAAELDSPRQTGKLSDRFPNIELTTHDGRVVRFYDDLVRDRTVIVNFFYTRCTGT